VSTIDRARWVARARRQGGMTLIELMIVIFLMGIIFSISVISVNSLTPIYRVRSASRSLASKIEEMRALAISTGRPMGIRYTMAEGSHYHQMIPPAPDEYPDEPVDDRRGGVKEEFPATVQIRQIRFPGGRTVKPPGVVNIIFSAMGTSGSHIVTLEGATREGKSILLSVKFNAITGTIDFSSGEEEFRNAED
jgi:type II secretion system protein H